MLPFTTSRLQHLAASTASSSRVSTAFSGLIQFQASFPSSSSNSRSLQNFWFPQTQPTSSSIAWFSSDNKKFSNEFLFKDNAMSEAALRHLNKKSQQPVTPQLTIPGSQYKEGFRPFTSPEQIADHLKQPLLPQTLTHNILGQPVSKFDPRYDSFGLPKENASDDREAVTWEMADGFHMCVVNTGFPAHLKAKGRVFKKSVTVVVGNANGLAGYATVNGSGTYPQLLYAAFRKAKRRVVPIPRLDGRTIYHSKKVKYVSTKLYMFTKGQDYGCSAPPYIKAACQLIGIEDISVKIYGSRNVNNVLHAFFKGLQEQNTFQDIAKQTGKNMVHLERSYRRGRLAMYY